MRKYLSGESPFPRPQTRSAWLCALAFSLAIGLAAALAGCDSAATGTLTTADIAKTQSTATTSATPPRPAPVTVAALGPFETTRDRVKLHGTVSPRGSSVRVNRAHAHVHGRRWSLVVAITHKGDNRFMVVGVKRGHASDRTSAVVTRNLSRAEKAAAAAARRQAFIGAAGTFPYKQILAHPSRFEGKKAVFHGQIFQVQEDSGTSVILLSVTHDDVLDIWDDHVWIDYDGTIRGAEGDMLTVYGTLSGTQDYDTQGGGNTTVPRIRARYVVE